jgi:hypothetical protein
LVILKLIFILKISELIIFTQRIFKEIKEQQDYDISAMERFEILKKYCNYGMQHWGSDSKGY